MLKIATWDDFFDIRDMLEEFSQNSPYKNVTLDFNKMESLIEGILNGDKSKAIILLYMKGEKPVGLLAGIKAEMTLNYDSLAHELIWWVNPEHRGGRAGIELFKAFEFWAKKVGCKKVQMSLVETADAPAVEKIYSKFGYTCTEKAFLKDI